MLGRGGSRGPKRKRNRDAVAYPSFPGESPPQSGRAGLRAPGAAALSEAWLRCEEGFRGTPGTPSLAAEKKSVTEKHIELFASPKKEATTSKSASGITEITWSSSGSDQSDEGELQFVDWERDSDREDTDDENEFEDSESAVEDRESAVEISDCASCASSHSLSSEERVSELPKASSTEILEYSSDSESKDNSENVFLIDFESSHKHPVEFGSNGGKVMEKWIIPRVKSADHILYTPQKQMKLPRTPEKSANKKQFSRGGLAERLNGLQNRERSAISLWRHQCVSYQKTLSGSRSGVLIVKILELHEECTIQVAMCEQLEGLQAGGSSPGAAPGPGLKVLFTKETARCLRGQPQDIIHICPPWQKLILPNGSCPVILNTYFCKKVVAEEDSGRTHEVHFGDTPLPRRNATLSQMFRFKSLTNNPPESQVMCSLPTLRTDWSHRHCSSQAPLSDSLLDTVESQGAATWSGVGVPVVVQRVYCLPGGRCQQGGGSAAPPNSEAPSFRVCLLVQDAYGMFGEVHAQGPGSEDRRLEGRSCRLAGMKVLQKATRARTAGLFSLIDTLWPPVVPLKAPGHGQACEEANTQLPPTFCYVLVAHPQLGHIDAIEDPVSKLYRPPVPCSLREILQTDELGARCSFYARVIYQRPLRSSLLLQQREVWLMVTDVSLQVPDGGRSGFPRTLPVCVTPSCVLGREVLEELATAALHRCFFRDALRDQGRIVCGERTVLLLPEPTGEVASGTRSCEPPGPVRLDGLDSITQANCLCSVQGAVTAVDEATAFSWPVCDRCGSDRLARSPGDRGAFSCADCSREVTAPALRRHLQVFLACPARPRCTVRVKLAQSSISALLSSAACEDGGCEVQNVIGKELGPLSCFVQSVATHPARCLGLEEIELLGADRASAGPAGHPRSL